MLSSLPDLINGAFEGLAGFAILNHCRVLHRAKVLSGVSILSTIFFMSWGFWNLFYYPNLGQWLSFTGGLFIMFANVLWLALMIRYRT